MLQKDYGKLFVLITVNQASIELSEKLSPMLKAYCNCDPTNEHPSLDVWWILQLFLVTVCYPFVQEMQIKVS